MDQRRLLLAFALSLGVFLVYQELVLKRYPPPAPVEVPPSQEIAPRIEPDPTEAGASLAAPVGQDLVTVETDAFTATIARRGGRLAKLELKAYRTTVDPLSNPLDLVGSDGSILPMTLRLGEATDAGLEYQSSRSTLILRGDERGTVSLRADTLDGRSVEKTYSFFGSGYVFDILVKSEATEHVALILTPIANAIASTQDHVSSLVFHDRKVDEHMVAAEQKVIAYPSVGWAGFSTQYFLMVGMPASEGAAAFLEKWNQTTLLSLKVPVVDGQAQFSSYVGPKERDQLIPAGHDLDRALDFGYFWFVAIPLLQALRILHSFTGNYGVAIIILTTLVKLATVPLTQTSLRNMREMQRIQPQMAKLRERFKDDQLALQKEMMELYRRHRVNPLSGCLPMLLQLPIFVGLYNALVHAIELRHAPFFLWIRDLSAPDRLTILGVGIPVLTLLMGVSMFVQQRLTPQQGDPTQQRVMMIMPVVFTFMFINFPAGLVLYWLVNNVLSIGQQYLMLRESHA